MFEIISKDMLGSEDFGEKAAHRIGMLRGTSELNLHVRLDAVMSFGGDVKVYKYSLVLEATGKS